MGIDPSYRQVRILQFFQNFNNCRCLLCVAFLSTGVVVGLKMLHGEIEEVKKEDPVLFKILTITRKMGFPDVIMPGKDT